MRILSIDDESNFTDMIRQYFALRGHEVDVASDGIAGLELLKRTKYIAVLLDLKMPGMSGEEVMAEIKKMGVTARIIFITAYNDSGKTREHLMEEGAYAVVEKPISSLKKLENLVIGSQKSGAWEEL